MTDIVEFLTSRIAEDEAAAVMCAVVYPSPWDVNDRGHSATVRADQPNFHVVTELDQMQVEFTVDLCWLSDVLGHIASWDPARVLAECHAKRVILSDHSPTSWTHGHQERPACRQCIDAEDESRVTCEWEVASRVLYPCDTVRALVGPWRGHPEFDADWLL